MSWIISFLHVQNEMNFFINCKFQFFIKILLLSIILNGNTVFNCNGSETIKTLDLSGNGPLFLSKKQIREDLTQASQLFRDNYVRNPIFEKNGINWEGVFEKLESFLLKDTNPILTHHFQNQLIKALEFTEDPNIQADLFLKKRHYFKRVEPKVAFYTGIKLAQKLNRFRVLPGFHQKKNIINHWFINCAKFQEVFFPVLPQRQAELLFMLGQQANYQLKHLNCTFESEAGVKKDTLLPLLIPESELNFEGNPIYKFIDGRVPYIRWYRDGSSEETSVKRFYKLARKLRKSQSLIIDIRGNKNGSFRFIENWLREYTSSHWKNVIIRELQTIQILNGLLNRVKWNVHHDASRHLIGKEQLGRKREQLRNLIYHFVEKGIDKKWVETKFIFNGKKNAPKWGTRLIIIANNHCGNGCQFLSALTKQIPNGTLIGTNTGSFPKNSFRPVFQLRNSRIMLTFDNKIHLNHLGEPVSTSGYLPDYWLFPPMGLTEIMRYANSTN